MITSDEVDLCSFDPGHPVTATVETDLRTMTRVWRGDLTWPGSQRSGSLHVHGPSHVARNLPRWMPTKSTVTGVPGSADVRRRRRRPLTQVEEPRIVGTLRIGRQSGSVEGIEPESPIFPPEVGPKVCDRAVECARVKVNNR